MVNVPQLVSSFATDGKWWNLPLVGALAYLAATRNLLYSQNLHSHWDEVLLEVGPAQANSFSNTSANDKDCSPWLSHRSLTGECNNLQHTDMGSFGAHLGRNVPSSGNSEILSNHTPSDAELFEPNARKVSTDLLLRQEFQAAPTLNLLSVGFIQFQVHDWVVHGRDFSAGPPFLIPRPADDPEGPGRVLVPRTTAKTLDGRVRRNVLFKNENTHWWDLSQLYGVTAEQSAKLRLFNDGKLKLNDTSGNLPFDAKDNMEVTGLRPNWWLGLSLMHNLYTREHNAICDMLKSHHSDWTDERLYNTARLINAATNARIHTLDWTTNILDTLPLRHAMHYNWQGAIPLSIQAWIPSTAKKALARLNHNIYSVFFGFMGGPTLFAKQPFVMTEEFTSIYRMHQLLPDVLNFWNTRGEKSSEEAISFQKTTFGSSRELLEGRGIEDLISTFGFEKAGALVLHNYPKWLTNITNPDDGNDWLIDLATQDVVKDRERQIPRYAEFREHVHLTPVRSYADINPDVLVQQRLRDIYGDDVRQVDLLVGCLAEQPRPQGFGFSDTTFQLFILMASRRLATDRFFTTDYREETYTKEGLEWVEKADLKTLLRRHFPALADILPGDGVSAFRPWDYGRRTEVKGPAAQPSQAGTAKVHQPPLFAVQQQQQS